MTQPDNTIDGQSASATPAKAKQPSASKSITRIKPIAGQLVGRFWENDQRVLFELAAKLNEVIAAVNDLATDSVKRTVRYSNPPDNAILSNLEGR